MWWVVWAGLAFAGKWDGKVADVVAERTVAAPPEAVFAVLADGARLQEIFPDDCADWGGPFDKSTPGGKAVVTYTAAGMHRRLTAVIKEQVPSSRVDLDHLGKKGFITRIALTPAGQGTKVVMTTYLNPPPKILAGYYYKKVQPAWQGCHARTLENLEAAASGSPN